MPLAEREGRPVAWWNRDNRAIEKRQLKAWEKRRRMGFLGFMLVWGVGAFGLSSGIASMTALILIEGIDRLSKLLGWWALVGVWLLGVCAFASGGVWWGTFMWCWMEWWYKRLVRKHGCEPTPPGTGDPDAG